MSGHVFEQLDQLFEVVLMDIHFYLLHLFLEGAHDRTHMAQRVALLVDAERLERDSGGDRVAGIGVARIPHAELVAALAQHLVDFVGHQDRADGQVGRRQRLGDRHQVRLDVVGLAGEPVARAHEARNHLIGDHQNVMLLENGLYLLEIGSGRRYQPAGAHHRLGNEGGDRVRTLADDQVVELLGQPAREILLALAVLSLAPVVRGRDVEEPFERHVEALLGVVDAGQARGG